MTNSESTRRLRVLHIITRVIRSGGAEKNTALTIEFTRSDFDVDLVAGGESEPEALAAMGLSPERVVVLGTLNNDINILNDFQCVWQMILIMRRGRYDVVHTHEAKANLLGRIAAVICGIPVVICGLHANTFRHPRLSWATKEIVLRIHKMLAPFTTHYVSVGYQIQNDFMKLGIGEYNKHCVIRSGFDVKGFQDARLNEEQNRKQLLSQLGLSEDIHIVGLVSALELRKGHRQALEVAEQVFAGIGSKKVVFLFVGDGELRPDLQKLIESKKLEGQVILAGYRPDIQNVMSCFDIQIHTSTQEGLPQAIVQGLILGNPLVVFDTDGISELITDRETGYVVPPGDVGAMAGHIIRLLASPNEMVQAGASASTALSWQAWDISEMRAKTTMFYAAIRATLLEIAAAGCRVGARAFRKHLEYGRRLVYKPDKTLNNRIRILHITQSLGGVETAIRLITNHVDDDRFESVVIAPSILTAFSKSHRLIFTIVLPFVRDISMLRDLYALVRCVAWIRRVRPHVVHCHSAKAGFIGRLAGWLMHVPTLYTPHAFSYISSSSGMKRRAFLTLEKLAGRWTTGLIACSKSEYNRAHEEVGLSSALCTFWTNSLDLKRVQVTADQTLDYVCSVGRLSYQKNYQMLIQAIEMARRGGNPTKCIVWGNGLYSPEAPEIAELIKKLGLEKLISIRDWSDHHSVMESVARSIVYVSTSRYEGMPFSILEAMALGKAVIATDVDGNRDCVVHGKTGLLVPADDPEALCQALSTLLRDHELRAEMGRQGRAEIEANFDIGKRISQLEDIYERVALKRPLMTGQ